MTDAGSEPASQSNVAAIVEALDVRARQAGTEGATTVLRAMLGTVSESLASIEHRLETLEGQLGGGDRAAGIADQVQAGLGAFNTRLGRLEEAFVKAVEDSGSGTQSVVEDVRAAVVASLPAPVPLGLDAESRQALDAAGTAVGRVEANLGRVEQTIAGAVRELGERVDQLASAKPPDNRADIEAALTAVSANVSSLEHALTHSEAMRASQEKPDFDALFARHIADVNARVEALAAAIANQPPPPPAPPAPVAPAPLDLTPFVERIDRLEKSLPRLMPRPPDPLPPAAPDLTPIVERIDRLETALPKLIPPPPEPVAPVDLTPVLDRLDALATQRPASSQDGQLIALVEQRLGAGINAMIARSEAATTSTKSTAEALAEQGKVVTELSTALRGLRTVVDRLEQAGPAAAARLEATTGRVARSTDDVPTKLDASVGRIAGMTADLRGELQAVIESVAKATTTSVDALKADVAAIKARVEMPPPEPVVAPTQPPTPARDDGESAARVVEAVRREAELLTQRVAALAVGVEATRALLDQHVEDTAESLGRKATDFGRRLAADFGIRGRKSSRRNDRRELGPGSK